MAPSPASAEGAPHLPSCDREGQAALFLGREEATLEFVDLRTSGF